MTICRVISEWYGLFIRAWGNSSTNIIKFALSVTDMSHFVNWRDYSNFVCYQSIPTKKEIKG